jgi:replication fork clamp-binding protein CrfC
MYRTMSLIDLPGMTRIPVKGQPEDISARLEALIMKYISNPACIILAVSAANTDLANSDAIALSRTVDPDGLRTIGASSPFLSFSSMSHEALARMAVKAHSFEDPSHA